jgi:hypothetical protein
MTPRWCGLLSAAGGQAVLGAVLASESRKIRA